MMILVTGGSGSGKSAFAEDCVLALGEKKRIYIATMFPFDEESKKRVARHRNMRSGKGFETVECYTGLKNVKVPVQSTVLLECMSNLTANEMFQENGAGENTVEAVIEGVGSLCRQAGDIVIVTNEIFSHNDLDGFGAPCLFYALAPYMFKGVEFDLTTCSAGNLDRELEHWFKEPDILRYTDVYIMDMTPDSDYSFKLLEQKFANHWLIFDHHESEAELRSGYSKNCILPLDENVTPSAVSLVWDFMTRQPNFALVPKQKQKELAELEKKMPVLEDQVKNLEDTLNTLSDYEEIKKVSDALEEKRNVLEESEMRWMELSEKMEG